MTVESVQLTSPTQACKAALLYVDKVALPEVEEPHPAYVNVASVITERDPFGMILMGRQGGNAGRATARRNALAQLLLAREASSPITTDVSDAFVFPSGIAAVVRSADRSSAFPVVLALLGSWIESA